MGLERRKRREIRRASKAQRDFSPAVFWLLLGMTMAVLGTCMLVPAWTSCQALAAQSRALSARLAECRLGALADQEAIEAAQYNVAFNERLLIEELNYQRPGEQTLCSSGQYVGQCGSASYVQAGQADPAATEQTGLGPPWLEGFVQRDSRSILLAVSGALVLFAFIYYPASGRSAGARQVPKIPVHTMRARFVQQTQCRQPQLYKT